jgi:hypothetical protein
LSDPRQVFDQRPKAHSRFGFTVLLPPQQLSQGVGAAWLCVPCEVSRRPGSVTVPAFRKDRGWLGGVLVLELVVAVAAARGRAIFCRAMRCQRSLVMKLGPLMKPVVAESNRGLRRASNTCTEYLTPVTDLAQQWDAISFANRSRYSLREVCWW